jgi:hypothetical protein
MAVLMSLGLMATSRSGIVIPVLVYAVTCHVNGYQFRRKHYLAAVLGIIIIPTVISPLEMYLRQFRVDSSVWESRFAVMRELVMIPDWTTVASASEEANTGGEGRGQYYQRSGTFVLGRVSMIRPDSNLISACAGGYHYGFMALKTDLLTQIPHFLYKNKPETNSSGDLGRVAGTNPDDVESTYGSFTAISDSYGAFGWWGVALMGMFIFPALLIIYDSIFDMRRPWGTVAMCPRCSVGWGMNVGGLMGMAIRTPIQILLLSYLLAGIVRMIPIKGD